jgi:hypothetical protein
VRYFLERGGLPGWFDHAPHSGLKQRSSPPPANDAATYHPNPAEPVADKTAATWDTMPGRGVARPGIGPAPGQAVVRSQTPKFWPLFHSTGELITTAPADVPVVVSMTWLVVHGPRSVPRTPV